MKILIGILAFFVIFFVLTFTIYFFHLDDKLIRKLYDVMSERFDNMERDRRL